MNTSLRKSIIVIIILALAMIIYFLNSSSQKSQRPEDITFQSIKGFVESTDDCLTVMPRLMQFIQTNGDYAEAWYLQGYCLVQLKDIQTAKVSFERALSIDPQMTEAKDVLDSLTPKAVLTTPPATINRKE